VTGWLAGILGIGGGLIRMPSLIYIVGCPTHIAVGTDLFEVMISGLYGAGTYTYKGRVELVAAIIMLVGAAIGAQIGAVATKYIKGYGIPRRLWYRRYRLRHLGGTETYPGLLSRALHVCDIMATWLILGLVSAMSIYIATKMVQGAKREIAAKKVTA